MRRDIMVSRVPNRNPQQKRSFGTSAIAVCDGVSGTQGKVSREGQRGERQTVETTDTDAELAKRPAIGQRHRSEFHRGFVRLHTGLWEDGDAEAGLHQPPDRVEGRDTDSNVQAPLRPLRSRGEQHVKRATILHADVIELEGLFERYARELRHRMPRRSEDDEAVGTVWEELEAARRHRRPEYADVDDAVAHGTHNVQAEVLLKVDVSPRIRSRMAKTLRAWWTSASPAAVNLTPREPRRKRGIASPRSSSWMRLLTAEAAMCSRSAARAMFLSAATARKRRSVSRSNWRSVRSIRIALSYDDNNEYRRRNVDHAADAVRREQRGSKNDEGISGACVR